MNALLTDAAKLTLIAFGFFYALSAYLIYTRPLRSKPLAKRRLAVASLIALAVLILDITEDTLGGDSGPIDRAILVWVHGHVPAAMHDFVAAVTFTGSASVVIPLTLIAILALALSKFRNEALLLFTSVTTSACMIYAVKAIVARDRPALWEPDSYWGSSFPSGHTLIVASFATAASLCVDRIRRAWIWPAVSIAIIWTLLVAVSRLIIGAHWPTDVLAAAGIGVFIPLAISLAYEVRHD